MFYFTTFFEAIYYKRWKGQDINNIKDFIRDSNCFVGILAFLIIIYSLTFFIPYACIYLFQLIHALKIRNLHAKDVEEDFYRY